MRMNLKSLLNQGRLRQTDYDYAGGISDSEAIELIKDAGRFLEVTLNWLRKNYIVF